MYIAGNLRIFKTTREEVKAYGKLQDLFFYFPDIKSLFKSTEHPVKDTLGL
jgi:hypothetical protein